MDLHDQLKHLFPDHIPERETEIPNKDICAFWIQDPPLLCKYEKRKGKPTTVIDGYNGSSKDFKLLAQFIKKNLNVGGGIKKEQIVIQGDFRDKIMAMLVEVGFNVKRVGG